MPAVAAHYQFGQLVLNKTNKKVKDLVNKNKEMFDLGLQGPDLLFYYKPQRKNIISKRGHDIHSKAGLEFFSNLIDSKEKIKESQLAYFIGACCHYSLDRYCHPLINKYSKNSVEHQKLESEFEFLIISKYNLSNKRYKMIPIKNISKKSLENIYIGVDTSKVKIANYTMRIANLFLQYRKLVEKFENIIGNSQVFSSLILPKNIEDYSKVYEILDQFNEAINDALNLIEIIIDENLDYIKLKENMLLNFEGVVE